MKSSVCIYTASTLCTWLTDRGGVCELIKRSTDGSYPWANSVMVRCRFLSFIFYSRSRFRCSFLHYTFKDVLKIGTCFEESSVPYQNLESNPALIVYVMRSRRARIKGAKNMWVEHRRKLFNFQLKKGPFVCETHEETFDINCHLHRVRFILIKITTGLPFSCFLNKEITSVKNKRPIFKNALIAIFNTNCSLMITGTGWILTATPEKKNILPSTLRQHEKWKEIEKKSAKKKNESSLSPYGAEV